VSYRISSSDYAQHQSAIQHVRRRVFIEEQGIDPALEWDEHDATAAFAIALDAQDRVIGTARLLPSGKIGRMAVLPENRHQGVATALLLHLLRIAKQHGHTRVTLAAQQTVMGFYEQQGFTAIGPPHVEAGIPHQNMQRPIS
jgi:predicted GNAT family N-acyltransferase